MNSVVRLNEITGLGQNKSKLWFGNHVWIGNICCILVGLSICFGIDPSLY